MWYELRGACWEQLVGLGQPEVAQEVRLDGDDDV